MSEKQSAAIKQWVYSGGAMILAKSSGENELSSFDGDFVSAVNDTQKVHELDGSDGYLSLIHISKLNLFVGKQGRITSTVAPANANNRNVEWTTSNSKVATVNNGTITAVSKGTAVITCKAKEGSGKLEKCTVTVSQPVTSIKLNATNKTIKKLSLIHI